MAGCDERKPPPAAAQVAPAVVVTAAERQPVTQSIEFVGRVEALEKVSIRARVTGFLDAQAFQEGQDVTEGDLLFTIEQGRVRGRSCGESRRRAQRAGAAYLRRVSGRPRPRTGTHECDTEGDAGPARGRATGVAAASVHGCAGRSAPGADQPRLYGDQESDQRADRPRRDHARQRGRTGFGRSLPSWSGRTRSR